MIRRSLLLLLSICVSLWVFERRATSDERPLFNAHGPLNYRNQHPLYLQVANIAPMRTVAMTPGVAEIRFTSTWSNLFEQFTVATHDVLFDMEVLRTSVHGAIGLGHGLTLAMEVPFVHNGGGFFDGILESYHNAFGFPNAGRELFPRHQFVYRVREPAVTLIDAQPSVFHLADLPITLRQEVLPETRHRPAIGWFATVELPTGSTARGLGNGTPDFGCGVAVEQSRGRWHGYVNLGYFVPGGIAAIEPLVHEAFFSYLLGAEYSVSRRIAVHAQWHGGTPLLATIPEQRWNWPPGDLAIGVSGEHPQLLWGRDLLWQAGFSEDILADGPSIDLSVFTQIGIRFGTR